MDNAGNIRLVSCQEKYYFNKTVIVIYYVLTLAVLSAARVFGNGPDYFSYIELFGNFHKRPELEPFYTVFRKFNDLLFGSSIFSIYFINTVIAVSIKLTAFKYLCTTYSDFLLCLVFYFLTFFFLHDYVQIRASLAIAVFLWSIKDIVQNNHLKFLTKTVLAICCHISAVMMLPFYIFCKLFKKNRSILVIVIAGFLFSVLAVNIGIFRKIEEIIVTVIKMSGLNRGSRGNIIISQFNLKYLGLLGLFILLYFIIDKKDTINGVLYKSFGFGLCFFYYLLPTGLWILSVRFSEFYTCVFIILLANNVRYVKIKEKSVKYCLFIAFILFYSYAVLKTIRN